MPYIESVHPFRTSFVYSNLNYALVTYISEKLGGKSWEDLIHEELFQPLGMDSTTFASTTPDFSKVATGYTNGPGSRHVPVSHALTRYIYIYYTKPKFNVLCKTISEKNL